MKTEITVKNFFINDLAKDIVNYLEKKQIKKVTIRLDYGPSTETKTLNLNQFEQLTQYIEEYLDSDDARFFYLNIPEIKTSIQSFTYGVDIISEQEDIKHHFSKYHTE